MFVFSAGQTGRLTGLSANATLTSLIVNEALITGAPKKTTDKLQRVLNAEARIVSNTRKYDRGLSQFRRHELHWLDANDRVRFRVCVQVYKCLYTTWHLDTCRHCANPCPAFLVVVTYARLVVVNCTFQVSIWLRTGDGRLPMPVPHLGTLYLTVSRTLILLCKPSNAILRLSFFLHTSTFSAFEVSYKNELYKSTVIILPMSLVAKRSPISPTGQHF